MHINTTETKKKILSFYLKLCIVYSYFVVPVFLGDCVSSVEAIPEWNRYNVGQEVTGVRILWWTGTVSFVLNIQM